MIVNNWQGLIDDRLLTLLARWIERRMVKMHPKHAFLPKEGTKYLLHKRYNKFGQAIFDMEVKEGLEFSRSTTPHQLDDIDEFGHLFITKFTDLEQTIIIAYVDPTDEFIDHNYWKEFIKAIGFKKQSYYHDTLTKLICRLQCLSAERRLVKHMENATQGMVEGWNNIAERLGVSVPTAIKWAETPELNLPVIRIGSKIYLIEDKLPEFYEILLTTHKYHMVKKKARKEIVERSCDC